MEKIHIAITSNLLEEINEYAKKYHSNNLSESIRELVGLGMEYLDVKNHKEVDNKMLDKIYLKLIYMRDLTEQFYSDMGIEESTNVKNCEALNEFKRKIKKDSFDE
jgi:metal-responsive CopG/Arc/MetJ family transcriptional regulator